jgi:CheY-like chemotaxis protein
LRDVIDRSLAVLAEPAARKGLEIGALIPDQLNSALRGDPGRLRQVLLNLAGNAVKFTEKGEVFLSVSLEEETEADVKLRFDISDTGIGIEPEVLNRLFQPFSQADETTARRFGGTGLGLAICKRIVNQMRGEVGVHSRQGAGSTFWLTARFQKQASGQSLVCKESKCPRSLRALVVDDNEVARLILSHHLLAWKIETVPVSTIAEAWSLLRQQADAGQPFNLVMLDMEMPQSAGFAESIQTDERLGRPRLIMLTSYSRNEGTRILRRNGIEACLTKPIKRTDLHRCLAKVIATDVIPNGSTTTPTAPATAAAAIPLKPLRILLAEDDAVNQKVALWQLEKMGYKADVVATGRQALEALGRVPYDVVLMDGRMPEMDGYEATRRLRANGHTVHIIAMTASAMQGDRDACLKAGMDDYICKPVGIDELKAAIERASESVKRNAR